MPRWGASYEHQHCILWRNKENVYLVTLYLELWPDWSDCRCAGWQVLGSNFIWYCIYPKYWDTLTLSKTPRKPASENVVCLCRLLKANSVEPDQTAPRGTVWSGSTLFAKMTFKITSRQQLLWFTVYGWTPYHDNPKIWKKVYFTTCWWSKIVLGKCQTE